MPKTAIEWTDESWNPLRGCSRVSAGCQNCYAEKFAFRFKSDGQPYEGLIAKGGQWNGNIKLVPELLNKPLSWKKPRKIFVNSMSDLFHENVPFEYIDQVFNIMALCPQHTFQILTKRPQRMLEYFFIASLVGSSEELFKNARLRWPLPNVWLGVSVENQETANERIPLLLQTPAAVRWISAEPLLGRVDLCETMNIWYNQTEGRLVQGEQLKSRAIDWVVVGGESGSSSRPMHPDWVRSLRDQCAAANVPFLFKQWGEWCPLENVPNDYKRRGRTKTAEWVFGKLFIQSVQFDDPEDGWCDEPHLYRIGKTKAGRLLDDVLHDDYPVIKESAHA